jgi:TRAP-type C4-dicarboxylate transport system substrate-binding protein
MKCIRLAMFVATALLAGAAAPAAALTIKLGSIAPSGSPWDDALRQIATQWSAISGGSVDIKIYPGGIAGDEDNMTRKMRIGQLNAAGMSGMGLCRVYSGILAVQLPLLVRTDDELRYVLDEMKPEFERELDAKGFKVVLWNKAGWAHFFSKRPVVHPDDLRAHKFFSYAGDADGIQAWKDAGFNPVPLSLTDLMTSLQSGMVDAFTTTPLSAAAYQWFALAPNMCAMKWAPLIGGVVVATATWQKIPADLQPKLLDAAQKIGISLQGQIDSADDKAIEAMKKYGLVVNPVPPEAEKEWKAACEAAFAKIAGKSFDSKSYEQVKLLLETFRKKNAR